MKIVDFTRDHIAEAVTLGLTNYEEERCHVPALPLINAIPYLPKIADNGLGVAAYDGGKMLGFLCCYKPHDNTFGIPGLRGVFSPMGGNAAIPENRTKIYAAMYQSAAEKWVCAGAVSHAISLYANDKETQEQFFRYGFGLRCVDAIRGMEEIVSLPCDGYTYCELSPDKFLEILPMEKKLCRHFLGSPTFMTKAPIDIEVFFKGDIFLKNIEKSRYFAARENEVSVAFLCAEVTGETFLCDIAGYIHISGAYCLPEHRGQGILQGLLSYAIRTLKNDGFTRMGTDFESINPVAYNFWLKYFNAYAHSVVRRIDENILKETRG